MALWQLDATGFATCIIAMIEAEEGAVTPIDPAG